MILRIIIILLLFAVLDAQGRGKGQMQIRIGPVTTLDRVGFRLSDMSFEEAMTAIIRIRVDNTELSSPYSTLIAPRTCQKQGSNWLCEAYIPSDVVDKINKPGKHEVYSFVFDGTGESEASRSWTVTSPK